MDNTLSNTPIKRVNGGRKGSEGEESANVPGGQQSMKENISLGVQSQSMISGNSGHSSGAPS